MKVKFHPSLMEIGAEVARDELRLARAAAMADYLASGDHGDARLLGFRCRRDEPPRVCRRLFCLSYAAMAG